MILRNLLRGIRSIRLAAKAPEVHSRALASQSHASLAWPGGSSSFQTTAQNLSGSNFSM